MNIELNSKQELYDFLNNFNFERIKDCKLANVYFLVEFNDSVLPIYFFPFEDVWFASPCQLSKYPLADEKVADIAWFFYAEDAFDDAYEYEMLMQRDGWHYEIYNPQCAPFLPDKIKIIDVFSEIKCLDWLISH